MDVELVAQAVRVRDAAKVVQLLFEGSPPSVRSGARVETDLWDYKEDVPQTSERWADIARHVLAFHNHRGGVLFFGVRDGDFAYVGATRRLDSKGFNDKLRRYLGDTLWVDFHREAIAANQRYLGVAVIPPRGSQLGYFKTDAPAGAQRRFEAGQCAVRKGDSSVVVDRAEALKLSAVSLTASSTGTFAIDEPFFRILALETDHVVRRPGLESAVARALSDSRTSVASLVGVGGSGKTTLATLAAIQAFEASAFSPIVSVTAKDRELAPRGITRLAPELTTFESLLDSISDVLGFPELKELPIKRRAMDVRSLLKDSGGLLYVDNLETVDDDRVVAFLDELPVGVKALVTSRRAKVRVAVRPVDVGGLSVDEARELARSLKNLPGLAYVMDLSDAEIDRVAEACERLPLAIRWILTRAASVDEAMRRAANLRDASARDDGELLEFAFRRVFESLTHVESSVMQTLSIFQEPSPLEALVAGSGREPFEVIDAIDDLVADALVQQRFASDRNDHVYALAPLTRSFVLREIRSRSGAEQSIRRRLTSWYEATDIKNAKDRAIVQELRQGRGAPEAALLDLAKAAQNRGDMKSADDLYRQALERNPSSWRAARHYAEFKRHVDTDHHRAIELYERAAAHAPARGSDRALIYREWGMLLRDAGTPGATDSAIEKFEIALVETPNDATLVHALATMYDRKGVSGKVIHLLTPLRSHQSQRTRELALKVLLRTYESMGDVVEAAQLRSELRELRGDQ